MKIDPKAVIANFKEIITKKYICFEGTAGLAEFWQFFLAVFVINFALSIVDSIIGIQILTGLFSLAILLPYLGVTVRRLRDAGKNPLLVLLLLLPLIGFIIVLLMLIKPSVNAVEAEAAAVDAKPEA